VTIIGTILHYDSVLSRLINNKLWRGKKFRAVEQWPENMAIWDTWTEILLNDGEQEALDFYRANPGMDKGAKICWPGGTSTS
jgi:hypothetical protein